MATASAAVLLSGCNSHLDEFLDEVGDKSVKELISLSSGDKGVLNYAYTLEQLEAAFFTMAVNNQSFMNGLTSADRRFFTEIRNHEVVHVEFFKAVLGNDAIPDLKFNFSSINFSNRNQVLRTASMFEDLGVAAYNARGQIPLQPGQSAACRQDRVGGSPPRGVFPGDSGQLRSGLRKSGFFLPVMIL